MESGATWQLGKAEETLMDFVEMVDQATGFHPYPYQRRLAEEGLPELLRAPTGAGKTAAAVLPWLYRRRYHGDSAVRHQTPHWLVYALPLRALVDQTEGRVLHWLTKLGVQNDVALHVLMGGRTDEADRWATQPDRDAILVGTIDMLLSRAMNRGYAASRYRWPVEFGIFNSGAQWVFDEVQLLGPALSTARQLQAFRDQFGTYLPTRSMWMSATVSPEWLETVDAPAVESMIEIGEEDRRGLLGVRLSATRRVRELTDRTDTKAIASEVVARHRQGTRTICFVNTVAAARELHAAIDRTTSADTVLVHSRFRPPDRERLTRKALASEIDDQGQIIVTTQAFEAGVDVTSTTMFMEAAPWTSVVQRAGRCNRYGESDEAVIWWYPPRRSEPYEEESIDRSVAVLRRVEGATLTGEQLAALSTETKPPYPVLRRRDLVELFDTTPALTGEDIDISSYIREDTERDVFVSWRDLPDGRPDDSIRLTREELCRVPLGEVRAWIKKLAKAKARRHVWRFDPSAGTWREVFEADLHPGLVLVADVESGGYTPTRGWDPRSKAAVPISLEQPSSSFDQASDEGLDADPLSQIGVWVTLADHLADTRRELRALLDGFAVPLPTPIRDAVESAAFLHDIGKAHPVFQAMLLASAAEDEHPSAATVWAKSSRAKHVRPARPGFRHELVSALMLAYNQHLLPEKVDLTRYLVAAHHGRVRTSVRPADADRSDGSVVVLGVVDGEESPPVELGDGRMVRKGVMDLAAVANMGGAGAWTRLALPLRDSPELGPFRLAWLEALVRLADWRASANPRRTVDVRKVEGEL